MNSVDVSVHLQLVKSAQTCNDPWEMLGHEGYTRSIIQISLNEKCISRVHLKVPYPRVPPYALMLWIIHTVDSTKRHIPLEVFQRGESRYGWTKIKLGFYHHAAVVYTCKLQIEQSSISHACSLSGHLTSQPVPFSFTMLSL